MRYGSYRQFINAALTHGWHSTADVPPDITADVSVARLSRWFKRLYRTDSALPYNGMPRLANHFTLGADPEFQVLNNDASPLIAGDYNLNVAGCAGSDGNGRTFELRAAPSRSALRVTASLLAAMRWLAVARPPLATCSWHAYPIRGREGVGGHIAFGRHKRVTREQEAALLDLLLQAFCTAQVFNTRAVNARCILTSYGRFSDVRRQTYGYEYRTFPTWLSSPWMTFLVLTAAKLVVHFRPSIRYTGPPTLLHFLAAYKDLDDDALLALRVLDRCGLPFQKDEDFREAWGIGRMEDASLGKVAEVPELEPSLHEVRELYNLLTGNTASLKMRVPDGLQKYTIPRGYALATQDNLETIQYLGISDLLRLLVLHRDFPIEFKRLDIPGDVLAFSGHFGNIDRTAREKLPGFCVGNTKSADAPGPSTLRPTIYMSRSVRMRPEKLKQLRAFLLSGLFPIWTLAEVRPDSFLRWQQGLSTSKQVSLIERG